MQKIGDCKEIRLALTRAGFATRPEKCLQTFRLVVTAQYISHNNEGRSLTSLPFPLHYPGYYPFVITRGSSFLTLD
jgi:hypothetical protein